MFKVFSIFDVKAGACLTPPIFSQTRGTCLRQVQQLLADPNLDFGKYPEDFRLFELGDWDPQAILLKVQDSPEDLGAFSQWKDE